MKIKKPLLIIFIIIALLIVLAPFVILASLTYGNPIMNRWIPIEVEKHLKEIGYTESDVLKQRIEIPKMVINHDFYHTHYSVIFADEPNIIYYYGKKKFFGEVVQFCEKNDTSLHVGDYIYYETQHSESHCISLLENR